MKFVWVLFLHSDGYNTISVPIPVSVNTSIRIEWGKRASTIETFSTPARTALTAVLTFGIIPPFMMPRDFNVSNSCSVTVDKSVEGSLGFIIKPGTSVM